MVTDWVQTFLIIFYKPINFYFHFMYQTPCLIHLQIFENFFAQICHMTYALASAMAWQSFNIIIKYFFEKGVLLHNYVMIE